jgi:hypothetical protein
MITPLVSSNSSYSNHVFFKLSNCIKYVCGYAYRIIEVMIMVTPAPLVTPAIIIVDYCFTIISCDDLVYCLF